MNARAAGHREAIRDLNRKHDAFWEEQRRRAGLRSLVRGSIAAPSTMRRETKAEIVTLKPVNNRISEAGAGTNAAALMSCLCMQRAPKSTYASAHSAQYYTTKLIQIIGSIRFHGILEAIFPA